MVHLRYFSSFTLLTKHFLIMRKLLLCAAFALCGLLTMNAQVSFGGKAGVNFASVNGDDVGSVDARTSFHVGGVVNISFNDVFGLQPEIIYSSQGFEIDGLGGGTGKLDYINIPVLVDITVVEGLSFQGGPQVGINITDEFDADGGGSGDLDAESIDLSAVAGAQYRLPMGVFFQARYALGITDVISDVDIKNGVFSLSVGYFFN